LQTIAIEIREDKNFVVNANDVEFIRQQSEVVLQKLRNQILELQ